MTYAEVVTILKDWAPIVRDAVVTAAAFAGACVGVSGLKTWKRQLKGTTEFGLAMNILTDVYAVRDAMQSLRNFTLRNPPPPERFDDLGLLDARHRLMQSLWSPHSSAMARFNANLLVSETIWGKEIAGHAKELQKAVRSIDGALMMEYLTRIPSPASPEDGPFKLDPVLYSNGSPDEFQKNLDKVVADIENELRPILGNRRG